MIGNIVVRLCKHVAKCGGERISFKGIIKAVKAYSQMTDSEILLEAFGRIGDDGGALFGKIKKSRDSGNTWLRSLGDNAGVVSRMKLMKDSIKKSTKKSCQTDAVVLLQVVCFEVLSIIADKLISKNKVIQQKYIN